MQFGDPRCNRTSFGFMVGTRWHPFIDDTNPIDIAARDAFLTHLGGITLGGVPNWVRAGRLIRGIAARPQLLSIGSKYLVSLLRRVGGIGELSRGRVRPMTFVMHTFMDAADVTPAWQLLQEGTLSDDPRIRTTQERLQACVYTMAHPESGSLVPACAQHSVLDAQENAHLRQLLPIVAVAAHQKARTSIPLDDHEDVSAPAASTTMLR